jgi:hypothetical protein
MRTVPGLASVLTWFRRRAGRPPNGGPEGGVLADEAFGMLGSGSWNTLFVLYGVVSGREAAGAQEVKAVARG